MSMSAPSGLPMYSVPRPRWLWVATGTWSKMRSIWSSVKPSATRRSRDEPAISCWAQGQAGHALGGDADEPAGAVAAGHRAPWSVYSSCVRIPETGAGLVSG